MTFEELYREFEKLTHDLCVDGKNEYLECAGIMMAQAMKIYKNVLHEDEFNIMIEAILKSTTELSVLKKPTLN